MRIGVVKFESIASTVTGLTNDIDKVTSDIGLTPYNAGLTNTRAGYNEAYLMLTTNNRGSDYK